VTDDTLTVACTAVAAMPPEALASVDGLLRRTGLHRDADVEVFALAHTGGVLVGCMGLAGDVVKCTAVDPGERGRHVANALLVELRHAALARGRDRLFCYTKPLYRRQFASLGFTPIAEVQGVATLMEDDPQGLARYCAGLATTRRPGARIGGIVMNANPFTRGHEYLVSCACEYCDVVHVFVVGETGSEFSYEDRIRLVRAGVAAMPVRDRVVVHDGSPYVVSRATFPQYFLKDDAEIDRAYAGIDLQIFRRAIAPALGIRHRFVGTEPLSGVTAYYNREMHEWLERVPMEAPTITVHEIPRVGTDRYPVVAASVVRRLLGERRIAELAALVPPTTYAAITAGNPATLRTKERRTPCGS